MALTEKGKRTISRLLIFVLIVGAGFGLRYAAQKGYGKSFMPSFMVEKVALDDRNAPKLAGTAMEFTGLPGTDIADLPAGAPEVRINFWAWNSQMGCLYSNGGPVTTENSLMAKQGVRMTIERQDDNSQLMAQLTALAAALHAGERDPKSGVHYVGIMGDGSGAFLAALNKQLIESFGEDYRAEIIGSCGYSRGEDKLMGPQAWRDDPQSMRGSVIAAVVRDGDWNIVVRYAADNGIPVNADETTYDPTAINFVNSASYTVAAEQLIQGYCEERPIVKDGKPTGERKNVCVEGAATWTPADVTIAQQKGGFVNVISTKEYANQMPHVLIGIRKWNQQNRATVEKVLTAFLQGGDQVLTFPKALDRASEISQEVNQEAGADAEYWKRYYLGVVEKDALGEDIHLGGSKANNLADNLVLFGLAPGTNPQSSRFRATYTVFGDIVSKMYPDLVPEVPAYEQIVDVSYLRNVARNSGTSEGRAETQTYAMNDSVTRIVGRRAVSINFATGSATPTSEGVRQLEQLLNELTINTLRVVIQGHTDNVGNPTSNLQLSERRADAIKTWLERRSPINFPAGRITTEAFGDSEPVASNSTESGRRQNRRVEILLGQ